MLQGDMESSKVRELIQIFLLYLSLPLPLPPSLFLSLSPSPSLSLPLSPLPLSPSPSLSLPPPQVNSICSLGEGSSFGESVMFGSKRETMIVTTDHCQLLCVEAEHIRKIYDDHKDSMKHLIGAPGRPVSSSSYDTPQDIADGRNSVSSEVEVYPADESQMSLPVVGCSN